MAGLTRKERQVLQLVGEGRSVKGMASELGVCVRAVELRRRSLTAKLQLESPLELMRFAVGVRQVLTENPRHDGWRLSPPAPAWPHGHLVALGEPA